MKYQRKKITKHLSLTEVREDDIQSLAHHINDQLIYENTIMVPYPYTVDDAEAFIKMLRNFEEEHGKQKDWAIRYKNAMVGGIGLLYNYGMDSHRTEIGYWIGGEFRNRGLMTKVLKAFTQICFRKLGLKRIEANVFEENVASQKALEKAGFHQEGYLKHAYIKDGVFKNSYLYARLSK